jgi:hypothetical protein
MAMSAAHFFSVGCSGTEPPVGAGGGSSRCCHLSEVQRGKTETIINKMSI